ncbi:MAG: Lrp/AsnC family transcriptional regulator [Phycisphaerales bacterium JB040]
MRLKTTDSPSLDATDHRLIKALQADARISNAELSRRVGLAASAVHERVKRLFESGVVRETVAVIEPQAVGLGLTAFLEVSTDAPMKSAEIAHGLGSISEVLEVHDVAGNACFLLRVVARDIDHLHRLLHEKIGRVPHVTGTSTTIVLKTFKDSRAVPLGTPRP